MSTKKWIYIEIIKNGEKHYIGKMKESPEIILMLRETFRNHNISIEQKSEHSELWTIQ